MPDTAYFAAHAPDAEEQLRLQGLEMLWDPVTRRRLLAAGIRTGQRCLEVGAGRGSVARLLAELTGTRVVAVDSDPRFLDPEDPRYEVRNVDITRETSLGGERFDVIHCRCLLMHLSAPLAVLQTLARCLSPEGFLLVEEPNMLTWAAADSTEPGGDLLNRVIQRSLQATETAGVWRNAVGPRLPRLLASAGLRVDSCEGACFVSGRRHPALLAVATQSLRLIAASSLASGAIEPEELEAAIGLIRERRVPTVSPTLFGAVARRPEAATPLS